MCFRVYDTTPGYFCIGSAAGTHVLLCAKPALPWLHHLPAPLPVFLLCSLATLSAHRISSLRGKQWSLIFFHKLAQCLGLRCLIMFIEWIKGLQPGTLRSFDFSFIIHLFNSQPVALIFQIWRLMTYISTPIKHMNSLLFVILPLIFFLQ